MKISTDINEIIPQTSRLTARIHRNPTELMDIPVSNNINSAVNQGILQKMNMERSYGEALSISQMSQSIIQKAMNISSRLRSIASQAFTTGKMDMAELSHSISEIDSTMKSYGEKVIMPVQFTANRDPARDMEKINLTLKNMKNLASDMKSGNHVDNGHLNKIDSELNRYNSEFSGKIKKYSDAMNIMVQEYPAGGSTEIKYQSADVIKKIETSPGDAMQAQGNISHGNAVRLVS